MKKYIKNNFNVSFISFVMCLIFSSFSVFATYMYMANEIVYASREYGDMTVATAIDDLYGAAKNYANPRGTIISVMRNSPPEGYLKCDGSIYKISDYKKLADLFKEEFGKVNYFGGDGVTTFAVPDLRGEFLRGTGTNSHTNQGSGSSVGIHQDATNVPVINQNSATGIDFYTGRTTGYDSLTATSTRGYAINGDTWNGSSLPATMTIRPTNTSVLYCIKY